MRYGDQLKKMRRFLRDPDAKIWDSTYLRTVFNDVQREVQLLTSFLEEVEDLSVPSFYQYSYMFNWEWRYLPGDQNRFHRCLRYHEQGDFAFCNRWEVHDYIDQTGTATEVGAHFTQPWEAWESLTSGEVVAMKLPDNFYKTKVIAYNYNPLVYVDKKTISFNDSAYQSKEGIPLFYYRDDELENTIVLYPRPSSINWDEVVQQSDPDFIYSFSWESTYISGTGEQWIREATDYNYIYLWEYSIDTQNDYGLRGMWLFEFGIEYDGLYGQVLYTEGDSVDATGAFAYGDLFNQEQGIAVSQISGTNNVICIYDAMATDIQDESDESDFPVFMRKYIEFGTLQRAYGANTDGRISSLRDYWGYRYEMGITMIKRFRSLRKSDRDYCLSSVQKPIKRKYRHPRLPNTYPDVNPV